MQRAVLTNYPHGVRKPWYTPTHAKKLAQEFACTFSSKSAFVVAQLESEDTAIRLIAFDIIEMIAWELHSRAIPLPPALLECQAPVPPKALREISSDSCVGSFSGHTIGEFLPFLLEHG